MSAPATVPIARAAAPYRVMLCDDSAVVRGIIRRILEADPNVKIVATAANGAIAVELLRHTPADVVVLDIEMPVLDGLAALPRLLAVQPRVKIIMASTLTVRNAAITMRALAAGAADYIAKPTTATEISSAGDFRRELLEKVKALGAAARTGASTGEISPHPVHGKASSALFALCRPSSAPPRVLAIGSSTGGPQALFTLLSALRPDFALPILITQHMPKTFTGILADHLATACGRPAREGQDDERIQPGRIYVAPGDYHMELARREDGVAIRLSKGPPENYCRPSVDPMFRAVAAVYGEAALGCILTGMGQDGRLGGQAVIAAGGTIIAQDEASSVVWGMPGAAATAGICSAVLPLADLAPRIRKLAGLRTP